MDLYRIVLSLLTNAFVFYIYEVIHSNTTVYCSTSCLAFAVLCIDIAALLWQSGETRFLLLTPDFSTSTPCHPQGNIQCERSNQSTWQTFSCCPIVNVSWKKTGKLFYQKLSVLSDHLFVFQQMKLHMNVSYRFHCETRTGSALLSWLLHPETVHLRHLVRNLDYPCGTTPLNLWGAIRRIL